MMGDTQAGSCQLFHRDSGDEPPGGETAGCASSNARIPRSPGKPSLPDQPAQPIRGELALQLHDRNGASAYLCWQSTGARCLVLVPSRCKRNARRGRRQVQWSLSIEVRGVECRNWLRRQLLLFWRLMSLDVVLSPLMMRGKGAVRE